MHDQTYVPTKTKRGRLGGTKAGRYFLVIVKLLLIFWLLSKYLPVIKYNETGYHQGYNGLCNKILMDAKLKIIQKKKY